MNLKPGKINEDNAFNSTLCKVPLEEGSIVIFITLMSMVYVWQYIMFLPVWQYSIQCNTTPFRLTSFLSLWHHSVQFYTTPFRVTPLFGVTPLCSAWHHSVLLYIYNTFMLPAYAFLRMFCGHVAPVDVAKNLFVPCLTWCVHSL